MHPRSQCQPQCLLKERKTLGHCNVSVEISNTSAYAPPTTCFFLSVCLLLSEPFSAAASCFLFLEAPSASASASVSASSAASALVEGLELEKRRSLQVGMAAQKKIKDEWKLQRKGEPVNQEEVTKIWFFLLLVPLVLFCLWCLSGIRYTGHLI
mmetsp:Transcript_43000/g.110816  ORF Transcript_43000/g.110816 Transcript_43000/m.110816 type:complete len:154 (-) Transcript_43000:118-579(-)